jgi:hypothetical protein
LQIKSKIQPSEVRVAHADAVGDAGYSNTEGKIHPHFTYGATRNGESAKDWIWREKLATELL